MISLVRISLLLFACLVPSVASALPFAPVGEKFSGSMSIDPSTQCMTCSVSSSSVFESFLNAGSISIDLAGTKFSGGPLSIEVSYDNTPGGPLGQWAGFAPTLDGSIQLLLDGTSRSTSILPLDLSQYQSMPPIEQISFTGVDSTGSVYSYAGSFTLLTQLDQSAKFSLEGTITRFEVFSSAVPEPSTWAMMILGGLGVGWRVRRRRSRLAPVSA